MTVFRLVLWLVVAAAIGLAGVLALSLWRGATDRDGAQAPVLGAAFELLDQDGAVITESAFAGRPTALFFGFTQCPEICPVSLFEVSSLMDELGSAKKDLQAFFISVDPARDSPAVIRGYLAPFSDNIGGITGDEAGITALAKSWGVYIEKVPLDDGDYTVDHTASVYLVDRKGRFRGTIAYRENRQTALEKMRLIIDL